MSTVIISKNSGSGNGSFTLIADGPNTGSETIHKQVIVRRSDGLSRTVTFTQLPNPEASSPWNAYGFYATESNAGQGVWGNYTNPGAPTIGKIYGNWEYNGIKQVDFGTYTNPYKIVFAKGGSYKKNFKVESFDIELNDCEWEVTTVKDSHTDITVTPTSAIASSGCTIKCSPEKLEVDSEHIYKFKQIKSGLEFYISVTIESNVDNPIPLAITAIDVQNIEAYVTEKKLLFNKITVTPPEAQSDFRSEQIARVEIADPSIARWDGEYIIALAKGETTFTVYLTNGVKNTTPAMLKVVDYVEPTPSGEGRTFLITYSWIGNADLDTATYIYTGDNDYIVTNAIVSEDYPNGEGTAVASGEFYGYYKRPTYRYLSDGSAVAIRSAESPQGNIWFAGNNFEISEIKSEQVMICMGDVAGGSRYGLINQLNTNYDENFNEDIFIDMYCNWSSTDSTPDHDGMDDGRQSIGKIVSIKIDEYENAGFTLDTSTNTFKATGANRLVNTWETEWRNPEEAVNGVYPAFTFGAADSLNAIDPKQYYASILRMTYNPQTREPQFTDLRFDYSHAITDEQPGKTPGVIPEFYPEVITNSDLFSNGDEDNVVCKWSGGDIADDMSDSITATSNGGQHREFLISGIPMDNPWVPVRIHSSLLQPTNGATFADSFNGSPDLQNFAHWGKGFSIKPLWCNESAKYVKVYYGKDSADMTQENLIGRIYPENANPNTHENEDIHVLNNTSDDSQYVDLIFDFSECRSDRFTLGEQQAAPWRYVDVVLTQDDSPELAHLSFRFEERSYINKTITEKRILWPKADAGGEPYKRVDDSMGTAVFTYYPSAKASAGEYNAGKYTACLYTFNDNRPATGQWTLQEHQPLFKSGIAEDVTVRARSLRIIDIPTWLKIGSTQGDGYIIDELHEGDIMETQNNEIRHPIGGNDFRVEFFNRRSNTPFFERQFMDHIYCEFERNNLPYVRQGYIEVDFEDYNSEDTATFLVWQGGTIKIIPEVVQSVDSGAFADGVVVYPNEWANGTQTEWRTCISGAENTTYKTAESEFITGSTSFATCDTFDLLGAGIRPGMNETTMSEEKRNVAIIFHIYEMNTDGEYVEYTSKQYLDVYVRLNVSDTQNFDYGHGGSSLNTITGKVDWNTEPDTAYVSVSIIESHEPAEQGQTGSGRIFGRFDVKLNLRANHMPESGLINPDPDELP